MASSFAFFIAAFSSLFTIINPFSTASVFVTIAQGRSKQEKRATAWKASVTAAIVLLVFAFAGSWILSFFSITVDAFRLAGGLLVANLGFRMVQSKREKIHTEKVKAELKEKDDISVIPLAIPMMSGPGAMTTALVLMRDARNVVDATGLVLAILIVCAITYYVVSRADHVTRFLGHTGNEVAGRIMGLIVMVVGIQFIINGLTGLVTTWGALF